MALYDLRPTMAPFMEFNKLAFQCYTKDDIERLSILRITETQTFDSVGYPVRRGLYDPFLGPTDQMDTCETCGQRQNFCPGHYGHLLLCLPVFNPMLFNITYEIMKGTCYHCNRFIGDSTSAKAKVLVAELQCIANGNLDAATAIKEIVNSYYESESTEDTKGRKKKVMLSAQDEEELMSKIQDIVGTSLQPSTSQATMSEGARFKHVKNSVKLRDECIKKFTKDVLLKRQVVCPHCKCRIGNVRNDSGRLILLDVVGDKSTKVKGLTIASNSSVDRAYANKESKLQLNGIIEKKSTLVPGLAVAAAEDTKAIDILEQQLSQIKSGSCSRLAWRALEVREHFRRLWTREQHIIRYVYPLFNTIHVDGSADKACPLDVLFMEAILVPPTKYRPIRLFAGEKYESPPTVNMRQLLETDQLLRMLRAADDSGSVPIEFRSLIESKTRGKNVSERIYNTYVELQQRANAIYDQAAIRGSEIAGLRQVLEKKEGLFRMNMMGKRVNFACRSVITPDPYLDVDEVGIPEIFAKKLTFAEPFGYFSESRLRESTCNGPDKYPGATFVQHVGQPKEVLMSANDRRAAAKGLRFGHGEGRKSASIVHRHLLAGDIMLMNRQPTLHRPSIMGHRARILRGQRALRMNYAPCKAYNADFDGDEMNGHYVQSQAAQVEASELIAVGQNYLVPKDGTPILGLIQDHVVAGVLMTVRGRFFSKLDFMHLLFSAFGIPDGRLRLPPPAIMKPKVLWSGKQIISALLDNCLTEGQPKINLVAKSKTPLSCWTVRGHNAPCFVMSESEVVFRQGELLVGVLDKAHYGATQFGLIHCCFELYGPKVAIRVLSCLSRIFPRFLQQHGFTLGVADILVTRKADRERAKAIRELRATGPDITRRAFGLEDDATTLAIRRRTAAAYNNPQHDPTGIQILDTAVKQTVAKFTERINNACVPKGLIRTFPENALQMMIQSGAKGSMVNSIQISCALGQIELEGQRPPLSCVGRSLPSFRCFDPSPRAGGFVDQRFLTGIDPQELFFHTMAGREGLIDTAVKTSRSGYLQRCVIKHLEGLVVAYDHTVRDHDGGVVQFQYGEDGMDVGRSTFMNGGRFDFLKDNRAAVRRTIHPLEMPAALSDKLRDQINAYIEKNNCNERFRKTLMWKGVRGMCEPGENVGLLAAQSIGEPSTQMTLNTFHFAGRGEMNVTLGIPRLREILMTSGANIKTPMVELEVLETTTEEQLAAIKREFTPVYLREVIKELTVREHLILRPQVSVRRYEMTIELKRSKERDSSTTHVKNEMILSRIESTIVLAIAHTLRRLYTEALNMDTAQHLRLREFNERVKKKEEDSAWPDESATSRRSGGDGGEDDEEGTGNRQRRRGGRPRDEGVSSDEEAEGGNDAGADERRLGQRHRDDAAEYEGEEEEMEAKPALGIYEADDTSLVQDKVEVEDEEASREPPTDDDVADENEGLMFVDKATADERMEKVVTSHETINSYTFDTKNQRWCTTTFELPLKTRTKFNVAGIIQRLIDSAVVWRTKNIDKCVVREDKRRGKNVRILQTQKINMEALYKYSRYLNVNTIYCNDVNKMREIYGVEACAKGIVMEMNNVFSVYGIEVNPRHLTLVADHMTNTGSILPFSRGAMSANASPLQKMTYETTLSFMRSAIMNADFDHLDSPSARLVTGQTLHSGTGSFDLLADLSHVAQLAPMKIDFYQ